MTKNQCYFFHLQTQDIRLPGHLVPEKYKIELIPFIIPNNFTIRGKVLVHLNCVSPGKNVTLHSADMDLDRKSIVLTETETGRQLKIVEHVVDEEREFYIAKTEETLTPGKAYSIKVIISFLNLAGALKAFIWGLFR